MIQRVKEFLYISQNIGLELLRRFNRLFTRIIFSSCIQGKIEKYQFIHKNNKLQFISLFDRKSPCFVKKQKFFLEGGGGSCKLFLFSVMYGLPFLQCIALSFIVVSR